MTAGGVPGTGPALTEPELFAAYDAEPELCMEPECAHPASDHADGCLECPCRGFDALGPPDPYDRAVDDRLTDAAERGRPIG